MIKRSELRNMSLDDLTDLLTNTLYAFMLNVSEEAGHILPNGFTLSTETENLELHLMSILMLRLRSPELKHLKILLIIAVVISINQVN